MDWTNAEINEIAAALAAAQGEFEPAVKRLTAKIVGQTKAGQKYEYKYSYADLAEILSAVMAALSKQGIAVIQPATVLQSPPRFQGDTSVLVQVQTVLLHKSGQVISFDALTLRADSDGPQAVGSALTYARRYSLQASLGIAPEVDDDGQAGQGAQPGGAGQRPDRRPVQQGNKERSQRQGNGPEQSSQRQPENQPQGEPSAEYQKLMGSIRGWVNDYPELFPDAKAVWQCMRPVCEQRNLSSANIKRINNADVFNAIKQPVIAAIGEYKAAMDKQQTKQVEGSI